MNKLNIYNYISIFIVASIILPLGWLLSDFSVLKKMYVVVTYNPGFQLIVISSMVFGLYRKFTKPEEFTWVELPIQLLTSIVGMFVIYSALFYTTTNLSDTEIWNGYGVKIEYLEEWTEEVTWEECDDDGNCTQHSRNDYHPPEWNIYNNNSEIFSINKTIYNEYVKYFNNEKKENLFRMGQVSFGDGDKFYVTHKPGMKPIWTAKNHTFINLLAASSSIKLRKGGTQEFKNLLLPYPTIHSGQFGPIEVDRVLDAGVNIPKEWKREVDRSLDEALAFLGKRKQVNILVYMVNTDDQSFLHALEEEWIHGKKNDVIVIIGTTNFPNIDWVSVMAWTDVEEFKIELGQNILKLKDLSNTNDLTKMIIHQVSLPAERGGFKRKPMEELEYLAYDIQLPFYANIFIILFGLMYSFGINFVLINNNISKYKISKTSWRR